MAYVDFFFGLFLTHYWCVVFFTIFLHYQYAIELDCGRLVSNVKINAGNQKK